MVIAMNQKMIHAFSAQTTHEPFAISIRLGVRKSVFNSLIVFRDQLTDRACWYPLILDPQVGRDRIPQVDTEAR
jgi:hypothetical protein